MKTKSFVIIGRLAFAIWISSEKTNILILLKFVLMYLIAFI